MSRPASGDAEVLKSARQAIASAQTVEQLRQAQAIVLPLDHGLSLADTARVLGLSRGWACQLRCRFMHGQIAGAPDAPTAGGRKRQNMTLEEEREFLAPFFEQAAAGGILVVGQIKAALDKRLGREVALASAYNLASTATTGENSPPTSVTHKATHRRRSSGKKTPRSTCPNPQRLGARQTRQADVSGRGALWPHLGRAPLLGTQAATARVPSHAHARIHLCLRGGRRVHGRA